MDEDSAKGFGKAHRVHSSRASPYHSDNEDMAMFLDNMHMGMFRNPLDSEVNKERAVKEIIQQYESFQAAKKQRQA